ncbi:MAG: hypothetical protein HYZ45_00195 [Burkholderiales bacterium]|nr:hypothetical protein [Burkholderiales bacterium]
MIVWGSGNVVNTIGETPSFTCDACKNEAPHRVVHTYKWGHIWYLGMVMEKAFYSVCPSCEQTTRLDAAKVEQDMQPKYQFNHRYGWAVWLVIFAFIFIFGAIADGKKKDDISMYLKAPAVGDVYALDIADFNQTKDEFHYSMMRIKAVQGTEIEFEPAKTAFDQRKGLSKAMSRHANDSNYFAKETMIVPRSKMEALANDGKVFEIVRTKDSNN